MRNVLSMVLFGSLVAVTGCVGMDELSSESTGELGKKTASPQLNLSHVVCDDTSGITAHFVVLLFSGTSQPGTLTGVNNGEPFTAEAEKLTGNVWHYNVSLDAGVIDITSAQVTKSSVVTASLHNPGEYSGTYSCGPEEPVCAVTVAPSALYCTDKPLKNPGAECGHFGLAYTGGKIDDVTGTSYTTLQGAYVAIVKSGTGDCGPGNSAYSVYVGVSTGDTLLTPTGGQDISHVTYCACPAAAPQP